MEKLAPSNITDALNAHKTYAILAEVISKRMTYIIEFCLKTCNGKLDWWDWRNKEGEENVTGDFIHSYDPNTLNVVINWKYENKMVFIDKNDEEQDLEWGEFPTRWLYEDFEDEFVNGIKLRQEKVREQAKKDTAKQQKKKQEKDALIAAAKAKLTPEELKALKNA
jgi:hypothetical protein